jgi:tetratricopeptide (TPR) repeat protein
MHSIYIIAIIVTTLLPASAQSLRALELFNKGVAASRSGDHETALARFSDVSSAIEREGASDRFVAAVNFNLGVSLYQLGRPGESIAPLQKALRYSNRMHPRAQYVLGLAQFDLGDLLAAEASFRRSIALSRDDAEAWYDLAFVHLAAKNYYAAKVAFAKAAKLGAAGSAASLNNLGVLLAFEGKLAEASIQFERAAAADRTGVAAANLEKCRRIMDNSSVANAAEFRFAARHSA